MSGHMENWFRTHVAFVKSTFSEGGNCVEVAKAQVIGVRNSKDPDGPMLFFTRSGWAAFAGRMVRGMASQSPVLFR